MIVNLTLPNLVSVMAIQFARIEYVSRSSGGNACRKAAYNQRESIKCERSGQLFYFKHKTDNVHHEIILPEGVDKKFLDASIMWNAAEFMENRKDSQVCKESVIALPDDPEVSLVDRIEISRRIADQLFVEKGLGVQLDIHRPHDGDKNWHVHMLITTRRFSEDGKSLHNRKARDTDPTVRKGVVMEAELVGQIVRDIQNEYFEEKGLDLRVDPIGIVPQEHLGPVRMRNHMNDALVRSEMLKQANEDNVKDPSTVLDQLTLQQAVFTQNDVVRFCTKHVPESHCQQVQTAILGHDRIVPLRCGKSGEKSQYFTTKDVRAEEEKLLRFAGRVANRQSFAIKEQVKTAALDGLALSAEQCQAFQHMTSNDSNLKIVQGRAGVGKSYVLNPVREAYESTGYRVIGLAPTNKVASDLADSGFQETMTCHSLLFRIKNKRLELDRNSVLVIDEAGMLGTEVMLELFNVAKQAKCKMILVGDEKQLPSIQRGGMFQVLSDQYGAPTLEIVRRQQKDWQKQVSEDLSNHRVRSAVNALAEYNKLNWNEDKETALTNLVNCWAKDSLGHRERWTFALAQRNVDVDALNQAMRDLRKQRGEIGAIDIEIMTTRGPTAFANGDRVQFTTTDKFQGISNGQFGVLGACSPDQFTVWCDNGQSISFDPRTYQGLRHGYAGTIYKAQGATIDKTYILHDKATNHSNSYVALTRHSQDVEIFLSKQDTRDQHQFVSQISRSGTKVASVSFATKEDLEKKQEQQRSSLLDKAQGIWTQVTDYFHSNPEFYQFKPQAQNIAQPAKVSSPAFAMDDKTPEQLSQLLERRSHKLFENKYQRAPNAEDKEILEQQSAKAVDHLYAFKDVHQRDPTNYDVNVTMARSKFELERAGKLRDELLKDLADRRDIAPTDHLTAQLYSERCAAIEGRMFEQELRERGQPGKNHYRFEQRAKDVLKEHQTIQSKLAQKLAGQFDLSDSMANRVAHESLRHWECTRMVPSEAMTRRYIELADHLEKRTPEIRESFKHMESAKQQSMSDFIQRRETDAWLQQKAFKPEQNPVQVPRYAERTQIIAQEVNVRLKQAEKQLQKSLGYSMDL